MREEDKSTTVSTSETWRPWLTQDERAFRDFVRAGVLMLLVVAMGLVALAGAASIVMVAAK